MKKIVLPDVDRLRANGGPHGEAVAARDDLWRQMCAMMNAAEAENRSLHASEARSYDQAEVVLNEVCEIVKASTVDRSSLAHPDRRPGRYERNQPLAKGQSMAGYVQARGLVAEDQEQLSIGKYLKGIAFGDWHDAPREIKASMTEGTLGAGGAMVPTPLSATIIDRARNQSRVMQAGAVTVPMESSTLKIARVASDPAVLWHTEAAAITPSDATLEVITLTAHSLAAIVQLSLELVEDTNADNLITDILGKQFALTIDAAALYGTGVNQPLGVKGATGVTTVSMGANGLVPTNYDFIADAEGTLADNNFDATGVILAPRTERELGKLKDTLGQPMRIPDYIADLPLYATNQIPVNLTVGTGTTCSDVFTADWSNLMIGVRHNISVQVLKERYADSGQLGLLCYWRGDVQLARPKAFCVTTGVL